MALSLIHLATNATYHVTVCAREYKSVEAVLDARIDYTNPPRSALRPGCVEFPAPGTKQP